VVIEYHQLGTWLSCPKVQCSGAVRQEDERKLMFAGPTSRWFVSQQFASSVLRLKQVKETSLILRV
jgi:hypothetical protein